MALKRQDALNTITEGIAWLAMQCKLRGLIHLFDTHTTSHEFFCRLLNEIYDLKLVMMDRLQPNFPAIDLGDEMNKRSFQVTTDKGADKIQATIDMYIKRNLMDRYGKLQFILIGERQATYNTLNIPATLPFVWEEDIIDTSHLVRIIEGLSTERLERSAQVVQAEIKIGDIQSTLDLHVAVFTEPNPNWRGTDDTRLSYSVDHHDGDTMVIRPFMPYLDRVKAGGPIEPQRYLTSTHCPFEWDFPYLDFKLLNRTSAPFLLAEAILDVEESVLDPTPVIVIREDTLRSCAGSIWIVNESSANLEDVTIRCQMTPGIVPLPPTFPDTYPYSESIGTLEDEIEIVVDGMFADTGVDIAGLNRLLSPDIESDGEHLKLHDDKDAEVTMTFEEHDHAVKRCLGPYQEAIGTIIGEIEFLVPVTGGERARHTVRFRTPVRIFNENRRGVPKPPSFTYDAELNVEGTNYQKRVDISQELQPGQSDRFLMKLAVRQSSCHRFRVTFLDIGGRTIQSPMIQLQCFVPRSRKGRVEHVLARGPVKQ